MMSLFSHVEIPTAHTSIMTSEQDYTAITPPRTHVWTEEHRLTLYLLREKYNISWGDIRLLFKALFEPELSSISGPSTAAFATMHYRLMKNDFYFSGSWLSLRKEIEFKARELGIVLKPSDSLNRDCNPETSKRSSKFDLNYDSDTDGTLLGDDFDMSQTPSKSTNRPRYANLETPLSTPISTQGKQRQRAAKKNIPRLAFRA